MNKIELRTAAVIGLLYIIRMLGLFMVLPVLPLAAQGFADATPFLVGVALGIYGLSQAALQIPLGLLSDRIGRKPVVLGGLIMFVVGSIVAGFADDIAGVIVGRFLQGCGAIASTLLALVSDVTRAEHRAKAMAIVGISIGSSFGLALILGPWIAGIAGLEGLFFMTAALGVLGIVVLAVLVPPAITRSRNPQSNISAGRIGAVLGNPDLRRTTIGVFMLHYLLMSSFIVLPVQMQTVGIAEAEHHLYYFWLLLGSFVLMSPLMRLSDRQGYGRRLLLLMIVFFIVAAAMLAAFHRYWVVLAAMVIFFMAFNLLEVILPAMVSKIAGAGERGTAMGVYSTAQFAGGFAGGMFGGLLAGTWDITTLMAANAVLCGIWLLYTFGISSQGNFRNVTIRLPGDQPVSVSHVTDALLSVNGVMDVALIPEERLAYLKVDLAQYDESALFGRLPSVTVVSPQV
jgi:MFS family permease